MADQTEPTNVEIRDVSAEEFLETGRGVAEYAFGASPAQRDLEELRTNLKYRAKSRNLILFADGQPQAVATLHEMTQHIRGRIVPMGGFGGVASMPAGRRRGYVRQVMTHCFESLRELGQPVSALYPFRESFYERLGYASFPRPRYATLNPSDLTPLVRLSKPGRVDQLPMAEGFEIWRAFIERYQQECHGFALRDVSASVYVKDKNQSWVAFAYEGNEITGAMTFRITGYTQALRADTFYCRSTAARYLLLDWIGRHVDQVKEAIVKLGPREFPELWFRDLEAQVSTVDEHAWPAPMARIISVRDLNGLHAGDGEITVQIVDDHAPWNTGTFTLRGEGGQLTVTDGGSPACTLTIQGLSALIYCGHDPADFFYRGWGDPDANAGTTLRALFPPAFPVLHEEF